MISRVYFLGQTVSHARKSISSAAVAKLMSLKKVTGAWILGLPRILPSCGCTNTASTARTGQISATSSSTSSPILPTICAKKTTKSARTSTWALANSAAKKIKFSCEATIPAALFPQIRKKLGSRWRLVYANGPTATWTIATACEKTNYPPNEHAPCTTDGSTRSPHSKLELKSDAFLWKVQKILHSADNSSWFYVAICRILSLKLPSCLTGHNSFFPVFRFSSTQKCFRKSKNFRQAGLLAEIWKNFKKLRLNSQSTHHKSTPRRW